jgi:SAM-dependent methyltransferase
VRLNLGCGRDVRPGWVNVDATPGDGVDVVFDLDSGVPLPFDDCSVSEVYGSHVLEHLHRPLPLMQELWRVARPGATARFRVPYGSSDAADEDPTHVRRLFLHSWSYFSQPFYWRASYGYRADWRTVRVVLQVESMFAHGSDDEVMAAVRVYRNVVREMVATLTAVKPARPADAALQQPFDVVLERPKEAS